MENESAVRAQERLFFSALVEGNLSALDAILAEDFLLIDLAGNQIGKTGLRELVGSGQLRFERIDPVEATVRLFDRVAVITGRTEMAGKAGETAFSASSRYTHVFASRAGNWVMVSAQGTPIAS